MRKIFTLFFAGLSTCALAQTQLSNGGFESWTLTKPAYDFYAPDNWLNGTACASVNDGEEQCTFTIARTTDAHSGNYAVKTFDKDGTNGGTTQYMSFGNMGAGEGLNGPAFTGRPESFSFYYKYATDDKQPMTVEVLLYSGDIMSASAVATGEVSISEGVNSYTLGEQTLTYFSTEAPTGILITVNYDPKPVTGKDTLTLDDFVFKYGTTTAVNDYVKGVDELSVSVADKYLRTSQTVSDLNIIDLSGNVVTGFNRAGTEFNLNGLNAGIYILSGTYQAQPFKHRLIVN